MSTLNAVKHDNNTTKTESNKYTEKGRKKININKQPILQNKKGKQARSKRRKGEEEEKSSTTK